MRINHINTVHIWSEERRRRRSPEQERNTSWSQREGPDGRAMEEGGGVGGAMDGRVSQLQVKAERVNSLHPSSPAEAPHVC